MERIPVQREIDTPAASSHCYRCSRGADRFPDPGSGDERLRVRRGSVGDPLNLNQVMLAKGIPAFKSFPRFRSWTGGRKPLLDLKCEISNLKSL